jgi:hypothetical protein
MYLRSSGVTWLRVRHQSRVRQPVTGRQSRRSAGCVSANVRETSRSPVVWFPVHIERVITEAVDVLRQVRADTGQSFLGLESIGAKNSRCIGHIQIMSNWLETIPCRVHIPRDALQEQDASVQMYTKFCGGPLAGSDLFAHEG